MSYEVNFTGLVKHNECYERYVFAYTDQCKQEFLDILRKWGLDPSLSLDATDVVSLICRAEEKNIREEFAEDIPAKI